MAFKKKKARPCKQLHRPHTEEAEGPILGPQQEEARRRILTFLKDDQRDFFLLKGYAGTGKSTLCRALLRSITDRRIILCATTNKAVGVLNEMVSDLRQPPLCSTIHRLLRLVIEENDRGQHHLVTTGEAHLSTSDLIIVDECSMIHMELYQHIQDLPCQWPGLKVLFMGDPAQLPPVGECESPSFDIPHAYELNQIHRQGEGHPVLAMAELLRKTMEAHPLSSSTAASTPPHIDFNALRPHRPLPVHGRITLHLDEGDWIQRMTSFFAQSKADHQLPNIRVLSYTNARSQRWNDLLQRHLYGKTEAPFHRDQVLILTAPIYEKNFQGRRRRRYNTDDEVRLIGFRRREWRDLEIWSLDLSGPDGKVVEVLYHTPDLQDTVDQALQDWTRERQNQPLGWQMVQNFKEQFARLQPSQATTIHRSQGSTFHHVFVDVDSFKAARDFRQALQLLYVAITRTRGGIDFLWSLPTESHS